MGVVVGLHGLSAGQALVLAGADGGVVQGPFLILLALPAGVGRRCQPGGGFLLPGRIQLVPVTDVALGLELLHVLERSLVDQAHQGILPVLERSQVHGTDLLPVAGAVGVVEGVVLQRDDHFLAVELDALQGQGSVPVLAAVLLLVVHSVKHLEGEVVLGLGHADDAAVGHGEAGVALVVRVVVHLDVVHHARLLVAPVDAEDVSLDAVVERARGDLDLALGTADVVAHGVNLVDGVGDQAVSHIEGADTDEHAHDGHRDQDAGQ